jgi:hypothetical protein
MGPAIAVESLKGRRHELASASFASFPRSNVRVVVGIASGIKRLGVRERRCFLERRNIGALVLFGLVAATACTSPPAEPEHAAPKEPETKKTNPNIPSAREDTRFVKIRNLLSQDPESFDRAKNLYPLVEPICTDEKERAEFVEVAKWSASFSIGQDRLPAVLALDTIEHVATSCARNYPAPALDLVTRAKAAIPDPYRHDLILARLKAAAGDLAGGLDAARTAMAGGSVHAIALAANIEAQLARGRAIGYAPGMLDEAIKLVSVEPDQKWQLIDLAAVLSTRAHLLTERAVWEDDPRATQLEAAKTYQRLSVAPFIAPQRDPSMDQLCFDSVELGEGPEKCARAANEASILGGAIAGNTARDATRLDIDRLEKIEKLGADLAQLPKDALVIVATRGDEQELISWARPASKVLAKLGEKNARVVLLDRTRTPRAAALVDRMFALAKVKPAEAIRSADTLAMPCLAAIAAVRQTPKACPLDKEQIQRLEKLARVEKKNRFAFALLIGRDLDAEIDDLKLNELRAVLLSFRQTRIEKGLDAWLKSLSDVWIVAKTK